MKLITNSKIYETTADFSLEEKSDIEHKINLELLHWQFWIVLFAAIGNIIAIYFTTYFKAVGTIHELKPLHAWLTIGITINIINFCLALYYRFIIIKIKHIMYWRWLYRVAIFLASLVWSSMNFLVMPTNISDQYNLILTLYGAAAIFAIFTITDIVSAILSVTFLLLPPILLPIEVRPRSW